MNREGVALGEWLHCYNRGVDKRRVFETKADYERLLLLVYLSKFEKPAHVANFRDRAFHDVLEDKTLDLGTQIVEVGAYSLMPNHLHFCLKEVKEGGIARFMQKVFTGYTMYFNKKNERTGSLFSGTYKSRHVSDDRYLKHLISYIHLNPVEIVEPKWKEGEGNLKEIRKFLNKFAYSSLAEFESIERPENALIDKSVFELYDKLPTTKQMLEEAQSYYRQM